MNGGAQPRQKIPKDGPGPRGAPDCYYTSRALNSTFRYVRFVQKLRALEEEQRRGEENKQKEIKDKQVSDFFARCDRKSLINKVARRVDLCMASYQEDLKQKRMRLKDLFNNEERRDIREFVTQAQAGAEEAWREKKKRLAYLLDKRHKEHQDKYKDTPLSKSSHVLPCIWKLRAKETQEVHLYQMKEKEARKMAEKEFDQMWHEVAMNESEALAARMEYDEIERKRKEDEIKRYSDIIIAEKLRRQEKDRELLKRETLMLKAKWEADIKKEDEAEELRKQKRVETGLDRMKMIKDRQTMLELQSNEDKQMNEMWDKLSKSYMKADNTAELIRKQKQVETNECNRKLIELRDCYALEAAGKPELVEEEARKYQEISDKKRCEYLAWSQKTNRDVRKAMIEQIQERKDAKEELKKRMLEQDEYQSQVFGQLSELTAHKQLTDALERRKHQQNLLDQIQYNKLLKERALQEERDQRKKAEIATREYEEDIKRMMNRPFFSDEVHPFMKPMAQGLKNPEKCPCSKPNYCK